MKRKQVSLIASILMTAAIAILIVIACFILPRLCEIYSIYRGGLDCTNLMTALYVSALPGLICCGALIVLLANIKRGEIFLPKNVTMLQIISYCCIFVGLEYLAFCYNYISMVLISFAALFFGLILRVIKNVFDKAIELREENDYTI